MYKTFSHIEDLLSEVDRDQNTNGSQAFTADRYPVRFVLFDNFIDSYAFTEKMQTEYGCQVESIENWFEEPHVDVLFTYSNLADRFKRFAKEHQDKCYVITPFSELIRFYDNTKRPEFYTLISTIKGIERDRNPKQRIYVPIVGLEGKFSQFENDSQIHVWYFKNNDSELNYRLIVSNATYYGVRYLDKNYTLVNNMREWLQIWRNKSAKKQIISLSPSIAAHVAFAQPDNAFTYCECKNVYRFLTDGLALNFGDLTYKQEEDKYWLRIASEINIDDFSFDKFFNSYFHIDDLADFQVFLKTWFGCRDDFEKWLLCNYYTYKFCGKGYICKVIKRSPSYIDYRFFAEVALAIFEEENPEQYVEERSVCMQFAAQKGIRLTQETQDELQVKLCSMASNNGYATAIRYFSSLTDAEKHLIIKWVGKQKISNDSVKEIFPELYYYFGNGLGDLDEDKLWIVNYIKNYKQSKIANKYSDAIKAMIEERNGSPVAFNSWYQDFRTVKTILKGRSDIEVFYWIDGLGIEWIPLISHLVEQKEGVYLNEIHIARALYPTTTENNKNELLELSKNGLQKVGDLDSYAHKPNGSYPNYILDEISIVKDALCSILDKYAGKKIAIVSDHGLTALSQYCGGQNLKGFTSDHCGRLALYENEKATKDNHYIICENNKTVCALQHESLCFKVPIGQSAHGGCTPEEVLVPIFVLSSEKNATEYSVTLLTKEISAANAIVRFKIKGINDTDKPYLIYVNQRYELKHDLEEFVSEKLYINAEIDSITLCIGTFSQTFQLKINKGSVEEDLFDF